MLDRRTFLAGLGSMAATGLPQTADAAITDGVQRSLFMEMAEAYALNGDKKAFRSLFRVQNAIRQIGAWPHTAETVERGMNALARVVAGESVDRDGFRRVRHLKGDRIVVFSDQHIMPDFNRQSAVWRANRAGYAAVLEHYGNDGWTVVENGDVEDLVILEPEVTAAMYAEALRPRGMRVRVGNRHTRGMVKGFREAPVELIERLIAARRPRRQQQFDAIYDTPGNRPYYTALERLAASGQLVRVAGNHDYDLQELDVPDHLVPYDVAIVPREELPFVILHGHQFDQATAPGVAVLYGEVISECLGVWFEGPDRTWGRGAVNRILEGGFPNRLSTHGDASHGGVPGALIAALLTGRAKGDEEWALAWERLFGHPIAWEYGSRDWQQGIRYGVVRPGDLIDRAMLGEQFFKFRHLDEAEIVMAMERWRLDIGLVLGHSHEVRSVRAGPVGRYHNSGAAGRFENLLWALELLPDRVEVVAWHLQPDGVCEKVYFEQRETRLFSYFETRRSGVRTRTDRT